VSLTPKYAPIPNWCDLSGMSRSSTYEKLGNGNLKAIKVGTRTLIDVEHGLNWLASMPAAEITTGRTRRGASSVTAPNDTRRLAKLETSLRRQTRGGNPTSVEASQHDPPTQRRRPETAQPAVAR
jgi:hypothetical protein